MALAENVKARFSLGGALRRASRGFFRTPQEPQELIVDERRIARVVEHETDKRILTEVEKYDADTLARVRAALYSD